MKLEIYQVGKLPPLTIVECNDFELIFDKVPRLRCFNIENSALYGQLKHTVAEFILSNIAGFKELEGDADATELWFRRC